MISLQHLNHCPSLQTKPTLRGESRLKFYTDTRRYAQPGVFVAIPGAKTNPLEIIDGLLNQGCPMVIYQSDETNEKIAKNLSRKHPKTQFLAVSDSVTFLQELAHAHIVEWKGRSPKNTVFAISGSNGKTTHKEMLSHMLKTILPGKVVSTEKNNNNHLGVPLTILEVGDQTEMLVLELGSNHPGEIKVLCDIATPNAGLITNIGATHLEFFGTEEKVFDEEGYLFKAVSEFTDGQGFILQNVDDPFLKRLKPTAGTVPYGESAGAQAKVSFSEKGGSIVYKGQELSVTNDLITGKHNKLNLITCAFIAQHFYPELKKEIIASASSFKPTKNRSEWMAFEGRSVFLDAYNANPSSMKAALQGFKESVEQQGHKLDETCVVLGDMNELGDSGPLYHKEVSDYVKSLGFPHVYFVGRFASDYQKGFPEGQARKSSAEFKEEYRNECLKKFAFHFIKGSRSLQLESLFDIK